MPKIIYSQWSEENMNNAFEAYRSKKYGFSECCRRFNIPKPTLKRHLEETLKRSLSLKKEMELLQLYLKMWNFNWLNILSV